MATDSSTRDPTDTAGLEQAQAEQTAAAKRKLLQHAEDFKWLMAHKQGRRIVWRLLDKAGVFRISYTGDNDTFFREGMRNIGLFVLADIQLHTPERYVEMLEENRQ